MMIAADVLPSCASRGRHAISGYRVIEPLADGSAAWTAWRLRTGRTHQIRVHARHLGHPLLADDSYGGSGGSAVAAIGRGKSARCVVHPFIRLPACTWHIAQEVLPGTCKTAALRNSVHALYLGPLLLGSYVVGHIRGGRHEPQDKRAALELRQLLDPVLPFVVMQLWAIVCLAPCVVGFTVKMSCSHEPEDACNFTVKNGGDGL